MAARSLSSDLKSGSRGLDRSTIEEKVTETVHFVLEVAGRVGSSLSSLEHNTHPSFWWTSWALGIVVGLFLLGMLVRVRNQLAQLNRYQAVFHRMWVEDREKEDRRWRQREKERWEKERERRMRREREKTKGKERLLGGEYSVSDTRQKQGYYDTQRQSQPQRQPKYRQYRGFVDDIIDAMGPIPEEGTSEYDEFVEGLRDAMQAEEHL